MKMLSNIVRLVDNYWAIGRWLFLGFGLTNQRFPSIKGSGLWSIAVPRALGRHLGEGSA